MYEATVRSVEAATHLTAAQAGAVAVLLELARTIDAMSERPRLQDNVTLPTYLKYADALGLTAAANAKFGKPESKGGSKLSQLRSTPQLRAVQGGKA